MVYVFPNLLPEKYVPAAKLFVSSYLDYPPGKTDHDLHVVVTGPKSDGSVDGLFKPIPVTVHHCDNYAKDLGAFKLASEMLDTDLLVCLGAHVNFRRAGWLDRIMLTLEMTGPTVCGPWGFQEPRPHLRTTFFCCPPKLLRTYPYDLRERYEFEHGRDNISMWTRRNGLEPLQITWTQVRKMEQWEPQPLHDNIARDQHSKRDYGE